MASALASARRARRAGPGPDLPVRRWAPVSPAPVDRKTKNLNPCSATSLAPAVRANTTMAAVKIGHHPHGRVLAGLAVRLGPRPGRWRGGGLTGRPDGRCGGRRTRGLPAGLAGAAAAGCPAGSAAGTAIGGAARSVAGGAKAGGADLGGAAAGGAVARLCVTYEAMPVRSVVSFIMVARISAAWSSAASIVSAACSPVRRTSSAASCCASASELDAWLRASRVISAARWLASSMIQSASCDAPASQICSRAGGRTGRPAGPSWRRR